MNNLWIHFVPKDHVMKVDEHLGDVLVGRPLAYVRITRSRTVKVIISPSKPFAQRLKVDNFYFSQGASDMSGA